MTPDATCNYNLYDDIWESYETFERTDTNYYLWHDAVDGWIISEVIGTEGALYWKADQASIVGTYSPMGTATGTATVALGEHP